MATNSGAAPATVDESTLCLMPLGLQGFGKAHSRGFPAHEPGDRPDPFNSITAGDALGMTKVVLPVICYCLPSAFACPQAES